MQQPPPDPTAPAPQPAPDYAPPPPPGFAPPAAYTSASAAPPTARLTFNQWFRQSPWWHKVLVILPLLLVPIGGLVGGLCGGGMAVANQSILRSRLGTAAKVWACLGVWIFGTIVFVVAEVLVALALNSR